jgi:hypothetical protein
MPHNHTQTIQLSTDLRSSRLEAPNCHWQNLIDPRSSTLRILQNCYMFLSGSSTLAPAPCQQRLPLAGQDAFLLKLLSPSEHRRHLSAMHRNGASSGVSTSSCSTWSSPAGSIAHVVTLRVHQSSKAQNRRLLVAAVSQIRGGHRRPPPCLIPSTSAKGFGASFTQQ